MSVSFQMIFQWYHDICTCTCDLSRLWNWPLLGVFVFHKHISISFFDTLFSSPELKAQVSFSDHLSSVVCLSVCLSVRPSVCLSVCLSVIFSHFHLLLQNHWANFN